MLASWNRLDTLLQDLLVCHAQMPVAGRTVPAQCPSLGLWKAFDDDGRWCTFHRPDHFGTEKDELVVALLACRADFALPVVVQLLSADK